MKLNLTKPLVIFDLETTGLDLVKDRIIQISYIKVYPDGREERGNELVNPEKPIEPIITQLTGISEEDVKNKPTFKQLGATLAEKFTGCDFAGFNSNHFDIPLLAEEFLVLIRKRELLHRLSALQVFFYNPLDAIRLHLDVPGHVSVVFVNIHNGLQITCAHAACDGQLGVDVPGFHLFFEFRFGFFGAGCNSAATLSDYYFHPCTS